MKIKTHKQIGASIKLFLETFGYKCLWNTLDANFDELVVLPPITPFLRRVKKEIDRSGFIPYHYSMEFNPNGQYVEGVELESGIKKIKFVGEVKEVKTFENISGDFHLIRYEDAEGNNYLNKRYKMENEIVMGPVTVDCRPVISLVGLNGEAVNLVNWARVKPVCVD